MKKFLSLALCLAMLFSCFTYAAPATVSVEDAGEEAESALTEQNALLTAELPEGVSATDPNYGELIVYHDFDNVKADTKYVVNGALQFPEVRWYDTDFFAAAGDGYTPRVYFNETSNSTGSPADIKVASDENANNYLSITAGIPGTASFYSLIRINTIDSSWNVKKLEQKGTYTLVADYKIPDLDATSINEFRNRVNYVKADGNSAEDHNVIKVATEYESGEWKTNTFSYVVDGVNRNENAGMFFMATGPYDTSKSTAQTTVYIDNIKVYYKPFPTVTFDANGVDATVPDAVTDTTFDLTSLKATPADANEYFFRGWSEEPDSDTIVDAAYAPSANTTLYAQWLKLNDEQYGELLYYNDFQGQTLGSEINNNYTYMSEKVEKAPGFGADGNYTRTATDIKGSRMVKVTAGSSGSKFSMLKFSFAKESGDTNTLSTAGDIYTLLADYYVPSSVNPVYKVLRTSLGNGTSHTGSDVRLFDATTDVDKIMTRGAQITFKDGEYVGQSYFLGESFGAEITADNLERTTFYIDNIRLYKLHPTSAKITFNANGVDATVSDTVYTDNNGNIDLANYAPTSYPGSKIFKGWSLTADGAVLGNTANFNEDTTLYAIWEDAPVHPLYSVKFNSPSAFTAHFNAPNSSKNGTYLEGLVETAYISEDGGFQRFTFKSKEGAADDTVGDPKTSSKNFSTPINTKNIKGIAVKYRFNNPSKAVNDSMDVFLSLNKPDSTGYCGIIAGTQVSATKKITSDKGSEWNIAYFDLAAKTNYKIDDNTYKWSDFSSMQMFRFDMINNAYDGLEMDIASIDFVLADGVTFDVSSAPTLTSANGAEAEDYRNGVLNVKFESDPGYTAENFYAEAVTDTGKVFDGTGNVEKITDTDGSVTYRMYAVKLMAGNTVVIKDKINETEGSVSGHLGAAVVYTPKTFDDGENIIPNGDFSNKFYNIWKMEGGSTSIENGSLKAVIGTGNQWRGLKAENIMFKPDTKYFYKVSIIYNDTDSFTYPENQSSGLTVYIPFQDGLFDTSKPEFNTKYSSLSLGGGKDGSLLGKEQSMTGVVTIMNEDFYSNIARKNSETSYSDSGKTASSLEELGKLTGKTYNTKYFYERAGSWSSEYNILFTKGAKLSILTAFSASQFNADGTWNANEPPVKGLTYNLTRYVIKEMWPVTVDADGGVGDDEIVYIAKDETITLPKTTKLTKEGYTFDGWLVDGVKSSTVTATAYLQNVSIKANWKSDVAAPVSHSDMTTIRTKTPSGLRFIASVANDVANDANVEYGFIVTRQTLLNDANIEAKNFTHDSNVKKTSGVSHDKDTHLTFNTDADNTFFAAALVGMKAENYKDVLVVRPYFKSEKGVYAYGEPMSASIYDVAKTKSESDEFNSYTDAQKAVIKAILDGDELPTA